jgi:hypothetical protein
MHAIFFADGKETDSYYSISEWWLEPRSRGLDTHARPDDPDDHISYVLAGTVSLLVEGEWTEATRG